MVLAARPTLAEVPLADLSFSGSPVVNRAGELVGLIFDGNIRSLVLDVAYDDARARAVAVDAEGILAALRRVYRAEGLVAELAPQPAAAGR
jgi:hypothetical protein